MSDSSPPPSAQIPGKSSGTGFYLVGIVVFGALTAGLLYWKLRPQPAPAPAPTATQAPVEARPVQPVLNAPPPPPPLEEVEDAGAAPGNSAAGAAPPPPKGPCTGKCGDGEPSAALSSAVNATAQSARGCYNRALRTSEVSGRLMVSLHVGSTGAVCSASIVEDSVHSGEIASCILSRFRGKSFPPPKSGCVVVNVPINFTIKQ